MPKNSLNVLLKGADDIFSTEESRQEQQREQVQQIPIGELFPFKNHPFKVLDDESMLVASILCGMLCTTIFLPMPHRILMPMFPLSIPSPRLALLVLPERILLTVQSM